MTRPRRVRISFELTEAEVKALLKHAAWAIRGLGHGSLLKALPKLTAAAERGLDRYQKRKGE